MLPLPLQSSYILYVLHGGLEGQIGDGAFCLEQGGRLSAQAKGSALDNWIVISFSQLPGMVAEIVKHQYSYYNNMRATLKNTDRPGYVRD